MILSFNYQLIFFVTAVATGGVIGFFYDILRIFRRIVRHGKIIVCIEDMIYWAAAAVAAFMVMLKSFDGEIRPFVVVGIFIGMVIYFCLPSVFIIGMAEKMLVVLRRIIKPVRRKCIGWVYPVKKLKDFLDKKYKKCLHLCKVYAKLKMKHFIFGVKSMTKK